MLTNHELMTRLTAPNYPGAATVYPAAVEPQPATCGAAQARAATLADQQQAVERVIRAMYERMQEPFCLEEMAEVAMLSPFHFARVFRRITGIPPAQFLYAVRLQAAKHLLMTTHMSVTDICFEVGYNSLGTFCHRFTELIGISPSRLRQLDIDAVIGGLHMLAHELPRSALAPPRASSVVGWLQAPDPAMEWTPEVIFIGAFRLSIPQSRPVACTIMSRPGSYRLGPLDDGRYHLFAAGLAGSKDSATIFCLNDSQILVGRGARPVQVQAGRCAERINICLRPLQFTDPPILTTLPLLLVEHLGLHR